MIYFNRLDERKIWLITMYAKNERASIPAVVGRTHSGVEVPYIADMGKC